MALSEATSFLDVVKQLQQMWLDHLLNCKDRPPRSQHRNKQNQANRRLVYKFNTALVFCKLKLFLSRTHIWSEDNVRQSVLKLRLFWIQQLPELLCFLYWGFITFFKSKNSKVYKYFLRKHFWKSRKYCPLFLQWPFEFIKKSNKRIHFLTL